MDFELSPGEKAYQKELREFLEKEVNEGVIAETEAKQGLGPYSMELLRKMGKKKLIAPSWPEKYGGRGLNFVTEAILIDEMMYHQGPFPLDGLSIGPAILRFGSEEQKEKYLPRIISGEIEFALGFTEPEAGSDVASAQIRAVEKDDHYIINGQKMFNTEAHYADYHWLLARTDPDAEKHRGLSMFIVDLKSPGITIRPLFTVAGLRTNEVFYEDVQVPKESLVGEKNRGWEVVMGALYGGGGGGEGGDMRMRFEQLVKYVIEEKQDILAENPEILDELAELDIKIHICSLLGYKAASMADKGVATYEGPLSHVFGTETRKHLFNVAMKILGPYGQLAKGSKWAPLDGILLHEYLDLCRWTIVHGSSEIQKIVIARQGLRLPKK